MNIFLKVGMNLPFTDQLPKIEFKIRDCDVFFLFFKNGENGFWPLKNSGWSDEKRDKEKIVKDYFLVIVTWNVLDASDVLLAVFFFFLLLSLASSFLAAMAAALSSSAEKENKL